MRYRSVSAGRRLPSLRPPTGGSVRFGDNRCVPRVIVAECRQEVSSFNPIRSRYGDFSVRFGAELFEYYSGARGELGGAVDVLRAEAGYELVPAYSAESVTSGGTLGAADFERIAGELLGELRKARPADGAYFALHGAMSAEGQDDPEAFLLEESRKILGDDIPIVVSLDLHGVLTDRMLELSDAIVVYHTYPHVDFYETGERAARLLMRILAGKAKPLMGRVKIPALVRGDELITETGSFGEVIRFAQEMEKHRAGLAAGMLIGNPFTDVPDLGTNSLVVTNDDREMATLWAAALTRQMWARHEEMQVPLTSIEEAVRLAGQTEGTAVLMDAADATSSGASGDSNAILREALASGYEGSVLAPIVDPSAAERAFAAGVGGTVRTAVGGALDPKRFQPLDIEARVKLLSDGQIRSESFGSRWDAGPTAVLEFGRCVLVVTSRPVSLFDRALFHAHGQDPKRFDLVVVKSPHCEPHMFADWCGRLINVDGPGATSANLRSLGHKKCARPVFPLDDEVPFEPEVEIFQRARYRPA